MKHFAPLIHNVWVKNFRQWTLSLRLHECSLPTHPCGYRVIVNTVTPWALRWVEQCLITPTRCIGRCWSPYALQEENHSNKALPLFNGWSLKCSFGSDIVKNWHQSEDLSRCVVQAKTRFTINTWSAQVTGLNRATIEFSTSFQNMIISHAVFMWTLLLVMKESKNFHDVYLLITYYSLNANAAVSVM